MPLVHVKLIEGVFNTDQKQEIITRSPRRWSTSRARPCAPSPGWSIEEVDSGEWGIGGKGLTTQDVKDLQATGK